MQDQYEEPMSRSLEGQVPVPPQAVPQVAMARYRSRVMTGGGEESSLPDFDGRTYE